MKYLLLALILTTTSCTTPRPWTSGEKLMLVASCLATAADAYTTIEGLENGCSEANPLVDENPSNTTVIAFAGITQVLFILWAHYWPNSRLGLLGVKTVVNSTCAVWNSTQY